MIISLPYIPSDITVTFPSRRGIRFHLPITPCNLHIRITVYRQPSLATSASRIHNARPKQGIRLIIHLPATAASFHPSPLTIVSGARMTATAVHEHLDHAASAHSERIHRIYELAYHPSMRCKFRLIAHLSPDDQPVLGLCVAPEKQWDRNLTQESDPGFTKHGSGPWHRAGPA